jgi:hypothetical protein
MAARKLTKRNMNEIIRATSDFLGEELQQVLLNDQTRTPLADLTKLVAGLMVERYSVRTREPVLAAMYGLTRDPKSYAAYAKMSPTARDAVDEVHRFKALIVQKRVTERLADPDLLKGLREMSGPGRVALLSWLTVMAVKLTGKKPDRMKLEVT